MTFGTFPGAAGQTGCASPRGSRRALEIVGIVFGVFYFWPAAAAYVGWKLLGYPVPTAWRERVQQGLDGFGFTSARPDWTQGFTGPASTGNRAFDEYRRGEIERLEAERRRLDDEAREFRGFVDDLKRAKDREEFDAYMAKRRKA